MKKKTWYHILGEFLKQYRKSILFYFGCVAIQVIVFLLYDVEMEAIWYSVSLCAMFGIFCLLAQFGTFNRQSKQREQIQHNIALCYGQMPKANNVVEQDYQNMIWELGELYKKQLADWKSWKQESLDYYTTWVHQIKTPIAVMQMILQGEDTKEHKELLAELFRVEQYVEMVLCYMRLGEDGSDFVFQEYSIDGIVKQAIHKYAPQFIRRKIRLVYESILENIVTDEKWFQFMVEQILSNAVKYTKQGTITIGCNEKKELCITDTGIGIAKEDLPRIFEKGFTGYNGRANKKSTGLGLYLCKKIAEKLSLGLDAESEPGVGTTIFIKISQERVV